MTTTTRKLDPKVGRKSGSFWKVGATEKWGQVDGRHHTRGIPHLWADVVVTGYPLCGLSSWYGDTPSKGWCHKRGIPPLWADVMRRQLTGRNVRHDDGSINLFVFAWSVPHSWHNNFSNTRLTVPCCFYGIVFGNCGRVLLTIDSLVL